MEHKEVADYSYGSPRWPCVEFSLGEARSQWGLEWCTDNSVPVLSHSFPHLTFVFWTIFPFPKLPAQPFPSHSQKMTFLPSSGKMLKLLDQNAHISSYPGLLVFKIQSRRLKIAPKFLIPFSFTVLFCQLSPRGLSPFPHSQAFDSHIVNLLRFQPP